MRTRTLPPAARGRTHQIPETEESRPMATNDQKQQAREKREQAQAAALAAQKRNRNIQLLGGALFAAIVVVVLVVIIGVRATRRPEPAALRPGEDVQGIAETKSLLAGIKQEGLTLGDPKAAVTIVEFLDVQCPFCRKHELDEQPKVISELIKTGKARLTAQPVALPQMGEDPRPAAPWCCASRRRTSPGTSSTSSTGTWAMRPRAT